MPAEVFMMDLRARHGENLHRKLRRLLEVAGIRDVVGKGDLVAVKIHFGEMGNMGYLRPDWASTVVEVIKDLGGKPFMTDANTLYRGSRANAVDHLITAMKHGFVYEVIGAPVIIADGLKGVDDVEVEINLKRVKTAKIGSAIYFADALVVMTHFKGHGMSGFGGSIKNVGMGCASRKGKLEQHAGSKPVVDEGKCVGCRTCERNCPTGAIKVVDGKAKIDRDVCIGCGECLALCPVEAIRAESEKSTEAFLEKMAEYTYAVLKGKEGKALFINFLIDISPECDCWSHNDYPIVPDVGVLASKDIVAIDKASADLVNQQKPLEAGMLGGKPAPDKFKALYPNINWEHLLKYAEEIGLGTTEYVLKKV